MGTVVNHRAGFWLRFKQVFLVDYIIFYTRKETKDPIVRVSVVLSI